MDDRRITPADTDVLNRSRDSAVFTSASEQLLERAKSIAEDVQDRVRRALEKDNPAAAETPQTPDAPSN